jgi:outer membrane immunogenic protein
MFKKIFALAAVSLALVATPAAAQTAAFDGPRIGALVGATGDDHPFDDAEFTYGGVAGYDFAVSDSFLLGVEADIASVSLDTGDFDVDNRQVSLALRGTYATSPTTAVFLSGGYTNLDVSEDNVSVDFDGFRLGGGAEFNISSRAYASVEYRYSQYDLGDFGGFDLGSEGVNSALVGLGLRF